MRRSDREIKDRSEIDDIVRSSSVCRLGMFDGETPYVVPLCFGYDGEAVYFHCAPEGRKLDILREFPHVCLEFDSSGEVVQGEQGCSWSLKYRSVIAFGRATFVRSTEAKWTALQSLMAQYAAPDLPSSFTDSAIHRTVIIKVAVHRITAKQCV